MPGTDDDLREMLLATFRDEADEHLSAITGELIALERGEGIDPDLAESVYRRTHSLKGAARAISLREIESVCQHLETALSAVRNGSFTPDAAGYDLFHRAVHLIRSILAGEKESPVAIIRELRAIKGEKPVIPEKRQAATPNRSEPPRVRETGTVRIANETLDRLITGSDELLTTRLSMGHRMRELDAMMIRFSLWQWTHVQVATDLRRIEELLRSDRDMIYEDWVALDRILKFQKKNREFIDSLRHDLTTHIQENARNLHILESSTQVIADTIHDAVLLPVSHILATFPGFIREVAGSSGKQVDFAVDGGEIEIDRRLLESLKDPLTHLIRNAIDHGIEHPGTRISKGKSPKGKIYIRIVPLAGSRVGIDISDDGKGIDPGAIRRSAIEKGLIPADEAETLSDDESINLVFRSGLSTSHDVTELSGRGLGLAIVEDAATRLGGDVTITSISGQNTCVRMYLPVRLSNFRGVVVSAGRRKYVIPMQQVRQVIRMKPGAEEVRIGDDLIRLIALERGLGVKLPPMKIDPNHPVPVVLLASGAGKLGIYVDEVIRVQEIVVRSLGSQLRHVRRIAGAGILDDGSVALVIDPLDLIISTLPRGEGRGGRLEPATGRVLVVEDSVTSREFLRAILEDAGYFVECAYDGADALQRLKQEEFDIVISDVDMPRVNGFALTEAIRSSSHLSSLPVVLVTSLDSPGDQEYGIHLGADAYIIKSMFEKDAFLRVVRDVSRHEA